MRKNVIEIGIDPGVTTGFALACDGVLAEVTSMTAVAAELRALELFGAVDCMTTVTVLFEDARLRTWFGNKGREALQGAGSVKRDCSRWEEFLLHHGIPFRPVPPKANATKLNAEHFARLTGWSRRTNEHGRDAACLVFKRRIQGASA